MLNTLLLLILVTARIVYNLAWGNKFQWLREIDLLSGQGYNVAWFERKRDISGEYSFFYRDQLLVNRETVVILKELPVMSFHYTFTGNAVLTL